MAIGLIGLIVIGIIAVVILVKFRQNFKLLKISNVTLISGAVKTGKSWLSVKLAIKMYKKNLFLWYLKKPINWLKLKVFKTIKEMPLKPVLYSNIPLRNVKYVLITDTLIFERKTKLPTDSVVLLDEVSLLADSLMIYNNDFNNLLKDFIKLFAHANGNNAYLIMNTQSLDDCHFNIKRCIGSYLYIYRTIKFPFISCMKVREMLSINGETLNVSGTDFEETCINYLIGNRYHKYYDSRCYSPLTDKFDWYNHTCNKINLRREAKVNKVLTLRNMYELYLSNARKEKQK